ncbi:MAG: iron-containing alcohol dehydrogenase, partial [Candidatus Latescibacteria bacterium]|nr:iron-containing alcohol dehydrogenase [Candidatus Latescibacterota bacterium]
MADTFVFARTPRIIFGAGVSGVLPSLISTMGRKALVVTGGSSFAASGGRGRLAGGLADAGIDVRWFSVDSEPSPDLVDE